MASLPPLFSWPRATYYARVVSGKIRGSEEIGLISFLRSDETFYYLAIRRSNKAFTIFPGPSQKKGYRLYTDPECVSLSSISIPTDAAWIESAENPSIKNLLFPPEVLQAKVRHRAVAALWERAFSK